jgi:hypothetical protein
LFTGSGGVDVGVHVVRVLRDGRVCRGQPPLALFLSAALGLLDLPPKNILDGFPLFPFDKFLNCPLLVVSNGALPYLRINETVQSQVVYIARSHTLRRLHRSLYNRLRRRGLNQNWSVEQHRGKQGRVC